MSYDPSKDKCLKQWKTGNDANDLVVGIYQYKEGEKKVGINRIVRNWKTGELVVSRAGRLNWDDVQFLQSIMDEIVQEMES